jgi:hypothetical protein
MKIERMTSLYKSAASLVESIGGSVSRNARAGYDVSIPDSQVVSRKEISSQQGKRWEKRYKIALKNGSNLIEVQGANERSLSAEGAVYASGAGLYRG